MTAARVHGKTLLGTPTSFVQEYLVTSPTDASGNTVHATLDDQLPKRGTGVSQPELQGAVAGWPRLLEELIQGELYLVVVSYDLPVGVAPTFGGSWSITFSGGVESVHVDTEVISAEDEKAGKFPRIIGPYAYEVAPVGPIDPAKFIEVAAGGQRLQIPKQPRDRKRIAVGADRPKSIVTVSAHKVFEGSANLDQVFAPLGHINGGAFRLRTKTFPPGTLLFSTGTVADERGEDGVTNDVVDLSFIYSPEGHQHRTVHTWTDSEGTELIVEVSTGTDVLEGDPLFGIKAGEPVTETFTLALPNDVFQGALA